MKFRVILPSIVFVFCLSAARAQTGAQTARNRPTFDAVSIKRDNGADPLGRLQFQPGGRLVITNLPLRPLIMTAYKLPMTGFTGGLILGAPSWVDSMPYDIEAKAQGDPPREQMLLMLQSMLADRFKLTLHWQTRVMPIYALVMVKPGKTGQRLLMHAADNSTCMAPHPQPLQPGEAPPSVPPPCGGGLRNSPGHLGAEVTMETLAKVLSYYQQIDRPVVDKTGLSGLFDLTLDYVPWQKLPGAPAVSLPETSSTDSALPSTIFEAVKEQLGLKLEATKGPVGVLVIDHVEQPRPN